MFRNTLAVLALALALPLFAAEALPANAKVSKLKVEPTKLSFDGPFGYSQLLVTAVLDSGEEVDVTRVAKLTAPKGVSLSASGLVRPTADSTGEIEITIAGQTVKVPVVAKNYASKNPVLFTRDVQPVLAKLGCNMGTCHGAAQGKNGFKLSLRGYDPLYDHRALTDDLEGRRFNRAAPERSLMLLKPSGGVPHAGGILFQGEDTNYELVRRWIAEGVKLDSGTPKVKSIEVIPGVVAISKPGQKQQFAVIATYLDGTKRDVSAETFIDSSNTEVATVDKAGLMTAVRRGETTMLARYDGAYTAASVVVMGDRSGYAWKQQPVYNPVDELVDAKLKKLKIVASELCTDEEFLRRIHLDLTGLPPSSDDVRAFLADKKPSKEKREAVIDSLIGSDVYLDHWANKWGDLLQVNSKFLGTNGAAALRKWIRDALAKNTPYDEMARSILTASGSNIENPPAAYFKTLREADAVMENTTQLFLAIRFNCNKCHDHPFEKWTQDQYFETSAFFARVGRKEDSKYPGQRIGGTDVEGSKPLVEVIEDLKAGEMKHERTGQNAAPKFPFPHGGAAIDAKASRRAQFAQWATAKENPYFAKSYVNRIWSYLTGVGIIEPVDDIRAGNPASNPELLDRLTKDFVESGFDTRKLMATICKSRTYQLSINTNAFNKDDEANASHALPRRLPAEVLFDTIHRATGALSRIPGLPAGSRASQLVDSNIELPGGFLELFGKPVRESACECERSNTMMLGPVLAMVNGPIVGDAIRDPKNKIVKFTESEKDDAKVVEEIYLSVLNRMPTKAEIEVGRRAIREGTGDHAALVADYTKRKAAFDQYAAGIGPKMKAFETGLLAQKPTAWTTLKPDTAVSRSGAKIQDVLKSTFRGKAGSEAKILDDGSVLVTGKVEQIDVYTLTLQVKQDKPLTGLRLEVLADDKLPGKGPGRAVNGNFVLHELLVKAQASGDEKAKALKLVKPQASFSQDGFPIAFAIDGNIGTGWAIVPQTGKTNRASFQFEKPLDCKAGVTLTITMDQRFGTGHTLGKFRFSTTSDSAVRLESPVAPDVAAILEMPDEKRTPAQREKIKQLYIAQDAEYQRLARDVPPTPPSDPRCIGAQDLTWALLNTPAFLFNR